MEGSLIPIWGWNPWFVYFFGLGIDYCMVRLIRRVFEGSWYTTRWWSFKVGDIIGLPVYMAFTAVVIHNTHHPDAWYTQWWWHVSVLIFGYVFWTLLQFNSWRTGFYSKEVIFNPSELYHSLVYGVMFYLVVSSLAPLGNDHHPMMATVWALLGLLVWIVCTAVDQSSLQDHTPETGRKAIWEMPWWPWKTTALIDIETWRG